MKVIKACAVFAAGALALGACGGDDGGGGGGGGGGNAERDPNTVAVFVSDAVQPVAQQLADRFRENNPDVTVEVTAAGQDAVIDSLTSDNPPNIVVYPDVWLEAPPEGVDPRPFGRNLAVIVVAPGNPEGIQGLDAFESGSGFDVRACGQQTPVGNFIAAVLAGAEISPAEGVVGTDCATEAADAVAAGELDAALLFRTDLRRRDDVEQVEIPEDDNVIFDLSYAVLDATPNATAFATFIDSNAGQTIRTNFGVLP